MNEPGHVSTSCDEALRLLSRSLDGDLTRAETRQLYLHLASCESCHAQMGEMAMLAAQLAELHRHYTSQSLDTTFIEKVQEAIRHVEQAPPTLTPAPQSVPQGSRFHVHEVQLYSAQDNIVWTHTQLVPPRDTIRLVVHQGHERSYHFRLQSWGPVPIAVIHQDARGGREASQQLILQGIRYAFLQTPHPNEAILIQNEGDQPIHVNAASQHPDALLVWILRHNSALGASDYPHHSPASDRRSGRESQIGENSP
jgi:hypothetical protein